MRREDAETEEMPEGNLENRLDEIGNSIFLLATAMVLGFFVLVLLILFYLPMKAQAAEKDTYISETAVAACEEAGEKYGICPELLEAIIERESGGNPGAENGGCVGLMQVYEKYHKERMERLGVSDLRDEWGNIMVGVDYLAELFAKYEDAGMVLMIYNGTSDAVERADQGILSDYADGILERSAQLERAHGK